MENLFHIEMSFNPLEDFPVPKDINGNKKLILSKDIHDKFYLMVKQLERKATLELTEDY